MAMDPQMKAMLRQTIRVATLSSTDRDQAPTFASSAAVSCRMEPDNRIVASATGNDLVTSYLIITENEIARTSRIWHSSDNPPSTSEGHLPLRVAQRINEDGTTSHWETFI